MQELFRLVASAGQVCDSPQAEESGNKLTPEDKDMLLRRISFPSFRKRMALCWGYEGQRLGTILAAPYPPPVPRGEIDVEAAMREDHRRKVEQGTVRRGLSPGELLVTAEGALELWKVGVPGRLSRIPLPVIDARMGGAGWADASTHGEYGLCGCLLPLVRAKTPAQMGATGSERIRRALEWWSQHFTEAYETPLLNGTVDPKRRISLERLAMLDVSGHYHWFDALVAGEYKSGGAHGARKAASK